MKIKIICVSGVFDLSTDERERGVVFAESDYTSALRTFAGDNTSITMRGKKFCARVSRDKVAPLLMGLLDR
ncbi:MAG: hypothetical protein RBT11_01745 [Desulfobacterales bacterium]|jgi:hypothetical protein|nr:hypothetical protein [Desulfobacterales bacterium]